MFRRSKLALAVLTLVASLTMAIGISVGTSLGTARLEAAELHIDTTDIGVVVVTRGAEMLDTVAIYRVPQPYFTARAGTGNVGGWVEECTMATDTAFAGELLYVSATGPTCRRTTSTTATHIATVGVAVAGASTNHKSVTDSVGVAAGTRLALPGAKVWYCSQCTTWVRADTGAGGTIAAGVQIRGPTYLGGRVGALAVAAGDSGKALGFGLRTGSAGGVFLARINR